VTQDPPSEGGLAYPRVIAYSSFREECTLKIKGMKKVLKLILCEVAKDPKQVVDKSTGVTLLKWRHVFMTPEGTELVAWSDNDGYRSRVKPALEYNPELATTFLFESRQWDGSERLKLIERTVAEAYLRELTPLNKKKE